MKPKLTAQYDGIVKIHGVDVPYSVLPDGRRLLVMEETTPRALIEFIKPSIPNAIRFQDTRGNVKTGIDVQLYPDAVAGYIKSNPQVELNNYLPWLIFKGLFLFGLIALLHSIGDEGDKSEQFNNTLRKISGPPALK